MVSKIIASAVAISSLTICALQNEPSLHDIATFVQGHRDDPTFFKKISYSLELKSNPDVNFEKWRSIVHSFVDLSLMAQHDTENNLAWLDLLGYPFKDVIALSGDKTGIHGDLNIGFGSDSLSLNGTVERAEQSDHESWKQIVTIWADVVNYAANSAKENYELTKGMGELLRTVLQSSKDCISVVIKWRIEDAQGNHYEIGYTN